MSGHSKWSTIKHKKGKTDQERGRVFSKIAREITMAARMGGGDAAGNSRLRLAVEKAKAANMPGDNVRRAIEKGTGGGAGGQLEEVIYEGYGPEGVAMMVDVVTDNKNRTVGEIRFIFSKHGGNLGEAGCVGWMFKERGVVLIEGASEEQLMEAAIELGAEDVHAEEGQCEVTVTPLQVEAMRDGLERKGFKVVSAEVTKMPSSTISIIGETAKKVLKLVSALEEHDDVQAVHANFDIPSDVMAEMAAAG